MNHTDWESSTERVGVVAACLVRRGHKYLLVKEKPDEEIVWNLPAGHVNKGEEIEAAAVREAKEETGYDVQLIRQIAIYHEAAAKTVKHVFSAEVVGGELMAQESEIIEVQWLTYNEAKAIEEAGKFRRPWVWDVISKNHLAVR